MIWLMATSQMNDSKNAKNGDSCFIPFDEKIKRRVPML